MTRSELAAFNEGIRTVLRAANKSADAIEKMPTYKSTRGGFAVEALRGLAEAGAELLVLPDKQHEKSERAA